MDVFTPLIRVMSASHWATGDVIEHVRLDQYNLQSLKYNFSGGDVLPKEVAKRWEKKFRHPIYEGYGATETCGWVVLTPAGGEKSGRNSR